MRVKITLACTECKQRNYNSMKNKKNNPDRMEMVMPGDHIDMNVELITQVAMDEGLRFAIREGGRTVGSGVVTSIVE